MCINNEYFVTIKMEKEKKDFFKTVLKMNFKYKNKMTHNDKYYNYKYMYNTQRTISCGYVVHMNIWNLNIMYVFTYHISIHVNNKE